MRTDRECKQRNGNSKKYLKDMLEIKNTVTVMKNAFCGLISRLTQPKKESINLKTGKQKLSKLKIKEENRMRVKGDRTSRISNTCGKLSCRDK